MVIFDNPNLPAQPKEGVYLWYAKKGERIENIYIGNAGERKSKYSIKGTLFRGISELQRNSFTTNSPKYDLIDTDFIIGTALKYFESIGWECHWKHINNDPKKEVELCLEHQPLFLQVEKRPIIKKKFKLKKSEGRWDIESYNMAETQLIEIFEKEAVEKKLK